MSSPNTDGGDPGSCGRFWIFISLGYLNNGRPRRDGSFWVAILVTVLWILIDNTVHEATPRYPQRNENSITGEGMPKIRAQARMRIPIDTASLSPPPPVLHHSCARHGVTGEP